MKLLNRLQTEPQLLRYAGRFIPIKIETRGDSWRSWARKYRFEGTSIPIVYVIRADGEMLYGKSGALPGIELYRMIESVLPRAGKFFSDKELALLDSVVSNAKSAQSRGDIRGEIRILNRLRKLGTVGKLESYADMAKEVDKRVAELSEEAQTEFAAARKKMQSSEGQLEGAMELSKIRREFGQLPSVKSAIREFLKSEDLNIEIWMKQADQLDSISSGSLRTALTKSRDLVDKFPDSQASALAIKLLSDKVTEEDIKKRFRWVSVQGTTVEARVDGFTRDQQNGVESVRLKNREGQTTVVNLDQLDPISQTLARSIGRLTES